MGKQNAQGASGQDANSEPTARGRRGAAKSAGGASAPVKAAAVQGSAELVRVALDELNLATFPISVLDKKAQSSREPLVFQDIVVVNGEKIERTWKVFPHPEKGFPGPIDDDVLMALLELTREQGGSKKVYFSRYDLLKRLGWSINATYYNRLDTSFKKLAAVRVEANNAFGDRNKKRFVNMGLTFIQEYKLNSETRGGERSSYVLWSDRIAESIHDELTRYLDATFYFEELTSPIERRLFRYLDNHFDGKHNLLTLDVRNLSHEHLGISRHYRYISQIMQRLEPALNIFVDKGYLESWLLAGESLHLYKKPDFVSRVQLALPFLSTVAGEKGEGAGDVDTLVGLLTERGVAPSVAARLCGDGSPAQLERVERAIEYFDVEISAGKQFANPGGFLVSLVGRGAAVDARGKGGERSARKASQNVAPPKGDPVRQDGEDFEAEFAYQNYLNETGVERYDALREPQRARLLEAKRKELLESSHRTTFRNMPPEAFDEHVRYMVRKDLASQHCAAFDVWRSAWEELTAANAG